MLKLKWGSRAREDLGIIIEYIAEDNPDAAQKLKDEIEKKAEKLQKHPQLYKLGRVQGTREMVVRENYIVIYMEDGSAVHVLRVLHAARAWP